MMRKLRLLPLLALFAALHGCGPKPAKVTGKVTCSGKPVRGSILFSPAGEGPENTGPAVPAPLGEDGTYTLEIATVGKHRIVVSPADVVYPAPPGGEFPCDLSAIEKTLTSGPNEVIIELPPPKR